MDAVGVSWLGIHGDDVSSACAAALALHPHPMPPASHFAVLDFLLFYRAAHSHPSCPMLCTSTLTATLCTNQIISHFTPTQNGTRRFPTVLLRMGSSL